MRRASGVLGFAGLGGAWVVGVRVVEFGRSVAEWGAGCSRVSGVGVSEVGGAR